MNIIATGQSLIWFLSFLLIINIAVIFIIRSDRKFLISISFWVILLISFFFFKAINTEKLQRLQNNYYNSMNGKSYGDFKIWRDLETKKYQYRQITINLFRLLGGQTIIAFIMQIVAYRKTKKQNIFWWTSAIFGVVTVVYFILEVFLGIVPTGPLI